MTMSPLLILLDRPVAVILAIELNSNVGQSLTIGLTVPKAATCPNPPLTQRFHFR